MSGDKGNGRVVTKFLFRGEYNTHPRHRVKWEPLQPNPSDWKTSVMRVDQLTEVQIWGLGQAWVEPKRNKSIRARADIDAAVVLQQPPLFLEHAPPPDEHMNIAGWPPTEDAVMVLAMELAEAATLHPRPGHVS